MGSAHPRFSRLPVKLSAAQHLVFRNSSVASGSLRMTQNDLVLSCCLSFIGRPRAADTADPLRPSVTSALIRVDFQVEQPLNLTSLALVTGRSSELPRYTKPPSTGLFYVGADPRVRPMLGAHMGAPLQKILRLLMVAWELSGGSWLSLLRVNGLRRRAAPGPEKPGVFICVMSEGVQEKANGLSPVCGPPENDYIRGRFKEFCLRPGLGANF